MTTLTDARLAEIEAHARQVITRDPHLTPHQVVVVNAHDVLCLLRLVDAALGLREPVHVDALQRRECLHCHASAVRGRSVLHAPDCPWALWQAALQEDIRAIPDPTLT
jgi:hypothetical protein